MCETSKILVAIGLIAWIIPMCIGFGGAYIANRIRHNYNQEEDSEI